MAIRTIAVALGLLIVATIWASRLTGAPDPHAALFETSDRCLACHNGMTTPSGEDVSIGASWRASMMANSARDPYWQAGVRRETIDHPMHGAAIEDECAKCHMPMSRTQARAEGREGEVFRHLPVTSRARAADRLAHDGVSCALCHQITSDQLGRPASFTGGYVIDPGSPRPRPMFGPFQVEKGIASIMRSATTFAPAEAEHIRDSELCATCHTLVTRALDENGKVVGELPEQMPYAEWRHSVYPARGRSCQACHMPVVEEDVPMSSVLGSPRRGVARHTFTGGNFFVLEMLARHGQELGVAALPHELRAGSGNALQMLKTQTASLDIASARLSGERLIVDLIVGNRAGHKLPTGYPSRRAWLHVTIADARGRVVFESGAPSQNGAILGNDNDDDPLRVEPHYTEIRDPGEVQIYESVMHDPEGRPTTGLLSAIGYAKDNRLLPVGFDRDTAPPDIAVHGEARTDRDFIDGRDTVRYAIPVNRSAGPFRIDAALRFQVIGFRWAENLRPYRSEETNRFVRYYESMASASSAVLVSARATSTAAP